VIIFLNRIKQFFVIETFFFISQAKNLLDKLFFGRIPGFSGPAKILSFARNKFHFLMRYLL
jgi:hypothetical protein